MVLDRADRRLVDLLERRGAMATMRGQVGLDVRTLPGDVMSISEMAV